jgi:hypothetical protein
MEELIIQTKICSICNEEKGLEQYNSIVKYPKTKEPYIYYFPYCIKCNREKSLRNRNENRDRAIQNNKEWKKQNRDRYLDYLSDYHKENREHEYIYMGEWQRNNKDKLKSYAEYREMNKTHTITNEEWEDCKNYFNYRCAYCNLPVEEHYIKYKGKLRLGDFHREHVNHEGSNDLSNCVPACKSCNTSKHDKHLDDWYTNKNEKYTYERLEKIHKWINEDFKKYIKNN